MGGRSRLNERRQYLLDGDRHRLARAGLVVDHQDLRFHPHRCAILAQSSQVVTAPYLAKLSPTVDDRAENRSNR